ncbi:MAG: alpha/beta hydrolase, partial [Acetobacteraceae bacterium]|nr:alpha/beta hydrolase [Acetobacteraceae bacterium]
HGTRRVSKAALVSAIPPLMLRTPANPGGQPREAFDAIRRGVAADRSQFYRDLSLPFFSANRPGSTVSQGVRDAFWLRCKQCGLRTALECITAFSESDFNGDFRRIDVPVLVVHGDDDQIVPVGNSARLTAQRIERATLKVIPGGSHGLMATHRAQFEAELLAFLRA